MHLDESYDYKESAEDKTCNQQLECNIDFLDCWPSLLLQAIWKMNFKSIQYILIAIQVYV